MSTNFDFLTAAPAFSSFSTQAIEAEKSLVISPATSAILSRRALELEPGSQRLKNNLEQMERAAENVPLQSPQDLL